MNSPTYAPDQMVIVDYRLGGAVEWAIVSPGLEGRKPCSAEDLAAIPSTGLGLLTEEWLYRVSDEFHRQFARGLADWLDSCTAFAEVHPLFREINFTAIDPFGSPKSESSWEIHWYGTEPRPVEIPESELAAEAWAAVDLTKIERDAYANVVAAYHQSGKLLNVSAPADPRSLPCR